MTNELPANDFLADAMLVNQQEDEDSLSAEQDYYYARMIEFMANTTHAIQDEFLIYK